MGIHLANRSAASPTGRGGQAHTRLARLALGLCLALASGTVLATGAAVLATPTAAMAESTVNGQITGSEILARAQFWLGKGITWSETGRYSDPQGSSYRTDCSGYVSMAWHISPPGLATAPWGLDTISDPIAKEQLQPGDILMASSVFDAQGNKLVDGHVALFESWADSGHNSYWAYEFGSTPVSHRIISYPYDPGDGRAFSPYHYRNAVSASADKLAFIKNVNTGSGTVEVHQAASPYQSHSSSTSSFSTAERFNGAFSLVGDKLVFIKTRNASSNKIELHWRTAGSGYQSGYDTPTSFNLWDAPNGVFSLVGSDLVFIKISNTGSGMVEVHKVSSANNYQNPPYLSVATPISTADAINGTFVMYGNDLVFIKLFNTGSGKVEVHILDGSCNFCQWKQHQVSLFSTADSANGKWTFADTVGNDGIGDLVFIKQWNTGTNTVELFAASGTSGYQQLSLATPTVFTPGDNANGLYSMNF